MTLTVRFNLNGASGPFSNLAEASADSGSGSTSDVSDNGTDPDSDRDGNPDEAGENDPTPIVPTVFLAQPAMTLTKVSNFDPAIHDNDGSGDLTPGDLLGYTISVSNITNGDALDVVVNDMPDANTSLVVGSVTTSQGAVVNGNTAGDSAIQVNIGTVVGSGGATVAFEVMINDPIPAGVTTIENQGRVSGSNFTDVLSDDPTTTTVSDPTVDRLAAVAAAVSAAVSVAIPVFPAWGVPTVALILICLVAWRRRMTLG
ncbi:DUF11 domain-containing protein [Parahaliea maris]|uniref:DUF11 domain-containing protein n=1 Tax=Parahaliea maris TaxID=2716870 RepID=A0A5C9A4Y0_9GAMM|nr:DUF11 domain-containing protein [Parahaliea maris]TXS95848.1 DUF11 domain-containing protein [Parahaliea maris]